jgi:hypothetical protein
MPSVLQQVSRFASRRAWRGEHWAWAVLAIASYVLRRAREDRNPVVLATPINPGDRLVISLRQPTSPTDVANA